MSAATSTSPPEAIGAGGPECGERIKEDGGGSWSCSFADSFRGERLNPRKWVPQRTDRTGYSHWATSCFIDSPNNISVSDGTLRLTARAESAPFTCENPLGDFATQYTSGMVSTAEGRFSQTYGRFEVRAKISPVRVRGLQTALWLWPANPNKYGSWPASGEIDIAEMFSEYPDRAIPHIHYYTRFATNANVTNTSCKISNPARFHTYAVEWTRRKIKVIYDDEKCLVHRLIPAAPLVKPQPFDHPFHVVLTQALGVGTNAFNPATTPLPATTMIDYVRVWK